MFQPRQFGSEVKQYGNGRDTQAVKLSQNLVERSPLLQSIKKEHGTINTQTVAVSAEPSASDAAEFQRIHPILTGHRRMV